MVSGGQAERAWDRGRGQRKSPAPVFREMTEELELTCHMDEAGGERWDGARVREVVHPGYLLEREKAITKGTSMAWNRKKKPR